MTTSSHGPYRTVRVRVTPAASRESVSLGKKSVLEISVKEKPKGGNANDRVRELVAKYFSVPVKNVRIIKGSTSRVKMIALYDSSHH